MKYPRPFVQRQFFKWLEMNRQHFNIPLHIKRRTDRVIEFEFNGLTPMLRGVLVRDWGISVYVVHDRECWDLLADLGLAEVQSERGYTNKLYLPEFVQFYPDRQTLWAEEVFHPFLEWCNTRLAQANWLALQGEKDKWTSACLSNEYDSTALCFAIRNEGRMSISAKVIDS